MTIGFIYKISSPSTDSVYIGSTTKTIKQRLRKHKSQYKVYLNNKTNYVSSFELVKYDDCMIELLEQFEFIEQFELFSREAHYIKLNNKSINKVIPNRTLKQYRLDNKEQIKEYAKHYRLDNKEKIKKYQVDNNEKQNAKHICDCGSSYTNHNKVQHLKTKKHQQYITNNNNTTNNIQNQINININLK
jgi:hypothetical protein